MEAGYTSGPSVGGLKRQIKEKIIGAELDLLTM
jgi:hypothetical protein